MPAPHSHDAYEETMYGVEGTLTWTVEGSQHPLGPGDHVCIKRGEVHGFVNSSGAHAKQPALRDTSASPSPTSPAASAATEAPSAT